ncbi:alpha/beta fold hydrolase [Kutzneria sp. NPDC052558]|uniref:alpha/beta fold hydrolase n=1 Tax=Kutzneria sp. NPDC052558 TaxID=3364121 RepID=UPI0037C8059F
MRDFEVGPEGARMRWVELPGDEPPTVYLHGLGSSAPAYFAQVAAATGRRSLLVDLLGFGLSDRPAGFGYTMEEHADAVAALLRGVDLVTVRVVGHSMGGAVAILLAERHPQLVGELILAEANLRPSEPRSMSARIAAYDEDEYVSAMHQRILGVVGPQWAATMRQADAAAMHRSAAALAGPRDRWFLHSLCALTIPRTFLLGELSRRPVDEQTMIDSGVVVSVVAGGGHNMMLDNPKAFVEALTR